MTKTKLQTLRPSLKQGCGLMKTKGLEILVKKRGSAGNSLSVKPSKGFVYL
ncbi:hypothetical protein BVC80_1065g41 [Macleaya cordata]|uniref:Uncharacterized protein n=1 Tax=Macleaya cordata TaxID=56857 RepID=A0A200RCQ1_MACCD|nr:hypothetical protein BVC80_1065g41 [Macleaya cordata]